MTDKLISDLSAIGAAIADNTAFEAQRNGQTTTEQALGSDLKTYIQSWLTKAMVGLSNVINPSNGKIGTNWGGYISGRWYIPNGVLLGGATSGIASHIRLFPVLISEACTITDMGVSIATAESGKSTQCAIYANNPATNKPTGNALGSTSSISMTSTGRVSAALGVSVALNPGLYWFGTNMDITTGALQNIGLVGGSPSLASTIGDATLATLWGLSASLNVGYDVVQTFNTWPDLTSATFTLPSTIPMVAYKVA